VAGPKRSCTAHIAGGRDGHPMTANGPSEPACIVAVPGSNPQASGEPVVPQAGGATLLAQPVSLPPYRQTVSASVTVKSHIG